MKVRTAVTISFKIATEELADGGWKASVVGQPVVEKGATEEEAIRRVGVLALYIAADRMSKQTDEQTRALLPKDKPKSQLVIATH